MHPVVVITQPSGVVLHVSIRGQLAVGRECDGLLIADPQVSRRHLSLEPVGGTVLVTDLGSTNGVTCNGARISGSVQLAPGDRVQLGETTLMLDASIDQTQRRAPDGAGRTMAADPSATMIGNAAAPPAPQPPPGPPPAPTEHRQRPIGGSDVGRQSSIDVLAANVRSEELSSLQVDQGTVTIVFSDIESSTQRNVEMGDRAWFELLGIHNEIVMGRVAEFGGTIIKNQGDGFMMSFPGARQALDCMSQVQRDLAAHSSAYPDRVIRIRIGLHTGEALADGDGDLFGTHVAMAARVANEADGNEIVLSGLTKEIVAARGDLVFGAPRTVFLKGFGDAVIYPFDWSAASS